MAPPPTSPVSYRQVNIVAFGSVCDVYGTDPTQFQVGTLAFVEAEAADDAPPFFVLVDTGDAPGPNTISCPHGPAQPGCTNPNVPVGTVPLRWRRLDTTFAV